MSDLWRATTPDAVNISDNFSQREFAAALQHLKPGKDPRPDSLCSEFILHAGAAFKSWLRDFLSSCMRRLKIPKIWRRALVVAIPKPAKPVGDPKSYQPISLLCVPHKILERLIYARVKPLIDPLLPKEQAGFRRGKSTVDQVVLLTQNIEDFLRLKRRPVPLLQLAKLITTWPGGTPRPSPTALSKSNTKKAKLKTLFQINCKQKSKNNGTAKYGTVWHGHCSWVSLYS